MDKVCNILALIVLSLAIIQRSDAVEYKVFNNVTNAGYGELVILRIGVNFSKKIMESATGFILKTLRASKTEDLRMDVPPVIGLFFQDIVGPYAFTKEDGVHMNVKYIDSFKGDVRREFVGLMFHEMAHVWQWFSDYNAPVGLTEGIADYIRLKAGFGKSEWVKPGEGDRWDRGYDVTARFLEYCEGLRNGFVAELNKRMKVVYKDEYFAQILGKNVHQLWADYKAKYNITRNHHRSSNLNKREIQ